MKHLAALIVAAFAASSLHAAILVNDTWIDGDRTNPVAPVYSENGTDSDSDGNLESAWFKGGSGTMQAVPNSMSVSNISTSSFWTTYFTPEASPVTLTSPGDAIRVTWVFTPYTVNASDTSQSFTLCLVDSPSTARVTSDASPAAAAYTGYALFMNMATTLGNSNPFQLRRFISTSGNLLGTSGNWGSMTNAVASGAPGYASGQQYTFQMTLTRNASAGLDIVATMKGGTLNTSGSNYLVFTETTPSNFVFDTFAIRPNSSAATALDWVFNSFKVETLSSGGCTGAGISTQPTDVTTFDGFSPTFSVSASGTSPTYQWQATNYAGSFTNISGATNTTYTTPALYTTNSGKYFRCIVSVACNSSSVTSTAAKATVNAIPSYGGILVNDTWQDSTSSDPVPPTFSETGFDNDSDGDIESAWYGAGSTSNPGQSNLVTGELTFYPQTNSRTWLTHCVSNGVIHLSDGEMVKATLVFVPTGATDNTNVGLSLGLLNYFATSATRLTNNISSSSAQGTGVQGYMAQLNLSTFIRTNSGPLLIRARTNLASGSLMNTAADYTPNFNTATYTDGAAGYGNGQLITNVFTVAKYSGLVRVSYTATGPSGTILTATSDDIYGANWINFDTFAVRAASDSTTATTLGVKQFKFEKTTAPVVANPGTLNVTNSSGNIVITWTNGAASLQVSSSVASGYGTISGATSPFTTNTSNSKLFFRLVQ